MILALDLATKTGVAVGNPGDRPLCFTERLGDAGEHHGARFCAALRMMDRLIRQHSPTEIVLEAPIGTAGGGSKARPEMLMGLRGCVMGVAHMRGVPFAQFEIRTIRKHFIGTAALKREQAKAATIQRCKLLGYGTLTDDEADAAALWDYACSLRSRSHAVASTPLFGENSR